MERFINLAVMGITVGSLYSIVTLGIVIIYKSSKILNLAHGGVLLLLSYLLYTLVTMWGLNIYIGLFIMLLASLVLGFLVQVIMIRPVIGQPLIAPIMMTFALHFIIQASVSLTWGGVWGAIPLLFSGVLQLGFLSISFQYVWSFLITVGLFVVLLLFYRFSRMGLGMRAIAESHIITQSLGVRVRSIFNISWAIAFFFGGAASFLLCEVYDVQEGIIHFGLAKGLPVMLLGGLESIPGALVGGLIVGLAEIFGSAYLDSLVGGGTREIIPFVLMLFILLFRPYGLFGLQIIERV